MRFVHVFICLVSSVGCRATSRLVAQRTRVQMLPSHVPTWSLPASGGRGCPVLGSILDRTQWLAVAVVSCTALCQSGPTTCIMGTGYV